MPISDLECPFPKSKTIQIFFIEEYQFRASFFCFWHFLKTSIFKALCQTLIMLIFQSLDLERILI